MLNYKILCTGKLGQSTVKDSLLAHVLYLVLLAISKQIGAPGHTKKPRGG